MCLVPHSLQVNTKRKWWILIYRPSLTLHDWVVSPLIPPPKGFTGWFFHCSAVLTISLTFCRSGANIAPSSGGPWSLTVSVARFGVSPYWNALSPVVWMKEMMRFLLPPQSENSWLIGIPSDRKKDERLLALIKLVRSQMKALSIYKGCVLLKMQVLLSSNIVWRAWRAWLYFIFFKGLAAGCQHVVSLPFPVDPCW